MITDKSNYPSEQRQLLIDHLLRDVSAESDESGIEIEAAFLNVAIRDLGYDLKRGFRTDGSGDFGFDFLEIGDREAFVVQSKCVDGDTLQEYFADNVLTPDKITDLGRILTVLENLSEIPVNANNSLKKALEELRISISRASRAIGESKLNPASENEPVFTVTVLFVALANKLSLQAQEEFDALNRRNEFRFDGIPVSIRLQLKFVDELISERWRKENDTWKDKAGKEREKARFTICDTQVLRPGPSYVFFTKAIDLVKAYESLGYQIFEPNVRAEVYNSPVNKEIKRSVASRKGREEFRHMNNGITIIAESIHGVGPKEKLSAIDVTKPGVVNGLQTVKSLHDGFKELRNVQDQSHFEQNCEVLCRVHALASVANVNDLIKATNNQNAMKPRNLRSNDPEQLIYEQLFAELNWFYQRKEGAWRAFKSSPKGWSKLGGKQPKDFKSIKSERVVDNEMMRSKELSVRRKRSTYGGRCACPEAKASQESSP